MGQVSPLHAALMRLRPAALASLVKRALRIRRRELATAQGTFWVDPVSNFGFTLMRDGAYEPAMAARLAAHLKPGGTFVDIGANEGYFSVIAAGLVGRDGRVVAVEPQERLSPVIRRNVRLNGADQIEVIQAGIADRRGEAMLNVSPDINSGTSSFHRPTRYALPRQSVPLMTLADLLSRARLERADLVKIDIEGFEHEAVTGSPVVFDERRIGALALELHPSILEARGLSAEAIRVFLREHGYRESEPDLWIPA